MFESWLNRLPAICQCCAQGKDARRADGKARCCAAGKCGHSNPSPRTVKDVRAVLRSALSAAMRDELVERNVAELVDDSSNASEGRALDQRGGTPLPRICQVRRGWALRRVRPGLSARYAERGSSRAALGRRRLRSPRADRGPPIAAGPPTAALYRETKTEASDDSLPLPDIACTALRLRISQQESARERAREAWRVFEDPQREPIDLVFTGRYGTPIDPRTFNRAFTARCDLAEVRRLTVHDARRTCATLLVDLDVHPRVIMRFLGTRTRVSR